MAEPLKNHFGSDMVHRAAASFARVYGEFDAAGFSAFALDGFDDLELTARAKRIGEAMAEFLPADRRIAIDLVLASLGPELENCDPADAEPAEPGNPLSTFFYLAHGYFVMTCGGEHFEQVMAANYELTKRGTSEFSIRVPLRDQPEPTLARLRQWAGDPNVHVRRLVSEGTRPRLPWAPRLAAFQHDPGPVIELLDLLVDDTVEYVRRSVANNLNDIAKDHPDVAVEVARRWWSDDDTNRQRLVRHGLRTLIKAGDLGALAVIGYRPDPPVEVGDVRIDPTAATIGDKVTIDAVINNPTDETVRALVDVRVHFVKANGSLRAKVFKGANLEIEPCGSARVRRSLSFAQHSTRTHYPGVHPIELLINGSTHPIGEVDLRAGA